MTKRLGRIVLLTGLAAAAASEVLAQTPPGPPNRVFVDVNVGAQPSRRFITTSSTFTLYDEPASVATSQRIGNGPVIDLSGGYWVRENLAIGVGFTSFSDTGTSAVTATIPDPLFFDRSVSVNSIATDLKHTERTLHLRAVWLVPVTDKIDVAVSAGPSFVKVGQQLVSSVTVPTGTQTINVVVSDESGTAKGVHVGFDGNYFFTARLGAGIFVRYTAASVDLPSAADLKVAGLNAGLGIRVRF